MMKDLEKSRRYYFGDGEEFKTKRGAMHQALCKRDAMLEAYKDRVCGSPEIVEGLNWVQVQMVVNFG